MSPVLGYVYDGATQQWVSRLAATDPIDVTPPDPIDPLDMPTNTNVGRPGIGNPSMTTNTSSYINTPGALYENVHFTAATQMGLVADNMTFRGCKFDDRISLEGANLLVEDCDVGGFVFRGNGVTARRCRTTGVIGKDLMAVSSDIKQAQNILVEQCYVGNAILSSESHLDGLQSRGVIGLTIRYCNFDIIPGGPLFNSQTNASVFIQNANGGNFDVLIEHNWSRVNGWYHFYLSDTAIEFSNNTIYYLNDPAHPSSTGEPFVFYPAGSYFGTGNEWEDGTPITIPTSL